MPRVKNEPALKEEKEKMEVPEFLADGHPNPAFFPKDGEGLEQFQAALDDRGLWGDYFGKLYRIAPLKSVGDKPYRCCKFASTLTLEQIEKTWGGKKWSVYFTRRVGTRDRMVGVFQFNIEAQPIWHDDEEQELVPTKAETGGAPGKADPMLTRLMEDLIVQRDRAMQEGKNFDVGDALQNALALQNQGFSSALQAISANLGKADNAGVMALTQIVTELVKANSRPRDDAIMQLLLQRALEKPEDSFQKITVFLTLLKDLGIRIGAGSRADGTDWVPLVEKGLDRLPDVLGTIRQGIAARTARPVTAPTLTEAAEASAAPSEISPETTDLIAQTVVKTTIVKMLFNGDSGDDAAHYAAMAHEPFARTLAEILKSNPEELRQDPILSQALTHVNALGFAKDFVDYFEEEEPEPAAKPEPPVSQEAQT